MDKGKKEIRIIVSEKKHKELKKEADELDIPLTNLIKIRLFGDKNA